MSLLYEPPPGLDRRILTGFASKHLCNAGDPGEGVSVTSEEVCVPLYAPMTETILAQRDS